MNLWIEEGLRVLAKRIHLLSTPRLRGKHRRGILGSEVAVPSHDGLLVFAANPMCWNLKGNVSERSGGVIVI